MKEAVQAGHPAAPVAQPPEAISSAACDPVLREGANDRVRPCTATEAQRTLAVALSADGYLLQRRMYEVGGWPLYRLEYVSCWAHGQKVAPWLAGRLRPPNSRPTANYPGG
ncbi:MAG: hypothetical protein EOO40_03865 [Deltaproteobacteria bacterium]|nr:MAG: hypothetical protein EOO40_03865 [Deltaproteobacteria bacterium]